MASDELEGSVAVLTKAFDVDDLLNASLDFEDAGGNFGNIPLGGG